MKDAIVRARVSPDLKADAEKVFETLGINTTEAIRMFLSQVRLRQAMPFAVEVSGNDDLLVSASVRKAALDSVYDIVPISAAPPPDFIARAQAVWGAVPTGQPLSAIVHDSRGSDT